MLLHSSFSHSQLNWRSMVVFESEHAAWQRAAMQTKDDFCFRLVAGNAKIVYNALMKVEWLLHVFIKFRKCCLKVFLLFRFSDSWEYRVFQKI